MDHSKATLLSGIKIVNTVGEFAHVILNYQCFTALRGANPALPFAASRNAAGEPVRIFDIEGTKVYSCAKRSDDGYVKTTFAMKAVDAEALGAVTTDALEFDSGLFVAAAQA